MARVNYQQEKRQRDLAKQKKREEKLRRKTEQRQNSGPENPTQPEGGEEPAPE